jgi:hypothetical protein
MAMHPSTRFVFTLLLLAATASELAAQRTIEAIGRPTPSHTSQRPIAISSDGRTIALRSATPSVQGGFRWVEGAGFTELFGFYTKRIPVLAAISSDGRVIVGSCEASGGGASEAAKWTTRASGDTLRDTPHGPGFDKATGVSADGSKVVGTLQGFPSGAFLWHNGTMTMLQPPPGLGIPAGATYANAISADGRVIVGRVSSGTMAFAVEWVDLVPRMLPGAATGSSGVAVSRDGSSILVTAFDHIYRFDRATSAYTDLGEAEFIRASPDGSAALAKTDGVTVLVDRAGRHRVDDILSDLKIGDGGVRSVEATAIGDGGRWIAGRGSSDEGDVAWRTSITPYISTRTLALVSTRQRTSSVASHVLLAGDTFDIAWRSALVDTVDIFYSYDDGGSWHPIVRNHVSIASAELAAPLRGRYHSTYRWTVPNDITSLARVKVVSVRDAAVVAITDTFTVRGVQFYRYSGRQIAAFRPGLNGWGFGNYGVTMWPAAWYSTFAYQSAIDPVTGGTYDELDGYWDPAVPSHFPDWRLFARTFGLSFAYRQTIESLIIDPVAATKWRGIREAWGGSCLGMSVAAGVAFSDSARLRLGYPMFGGLGGTPRINPFPIDDSLRVGINMIQSAQKTRSPVIRFTATDKRPWETVWEINDMLNSDPQVLRPLYISPENFAGAHAILPYRLVVDRLAGRAQIFVYDPNFPGDETRVVEIDSAANRWTYDNPVNDTLAAWTSTWLLLLMPPCKDYMLTPTPPPSAKTGGGLASAVPVTIGFDRPMSFAIGANGGTATYDGRVFRSTIAGCHAEFPITGRLSAPTGVTLDAARVSIGFYSDPGDTTGVYLHGDGTALHIASTAPGTSPLYRYDGAFTTIAKTNGTLSHVRAATSDDEVALRIDIAGYVLDIGDTTSAVTIDRGLTIHHRGAEATYDASVLVVDDEVGSRMYELSRIAIEPGATHTIKYVRDSRAVVIDIDTDSNGTIERSIELGRVSSIRGEGWLIEGGIDLK